jgi:DNA polymerase III epsilon subunit-like protein
MRNTEPNVDTLYFNFVAMLGTSQLVMPPSYLVVDTETTGFSPDKDRIWQIGVYVLQDGQAPYEHGQSFWLQTDEQILQHAMFEINRRTGRPTPGRDSGFIKDAVYEQSKTAFVEDVGSRGVDRNAAFMALITMINAYTAQGSMLVGQNICRFDSKFVGAECKRLGIEFSLDYEKVLDVGILFKAACLERRKIPRETNKQFLFRVAEERAKGVKWSVERLVDFYHLDVKYGVDLANAHDAGIDCWITHLALREMLLSAMEANA